MFQRLLNQPQTKPTLLVLGLFLLLTGFYFRPVFQGKTMQQSDVMQAIGMQKNINDYREQNPGQEPYWTMNMFSGMPAYTVHAKYEGNVLKYFQDAFVLSLPWPVGVVLVGLIGYFLLLRLFGIAVWLAAGASVAFVFFSYHVQILHAGHTNKFLTLMYAPYVLAGVRLVLRGDYLLGGVLLFAFMGLQVYGGHVQMTYYLGFVVFFYALFELAQAFLAKQVRHVLISAAVLSAGAGLGVAINAANLLPLNQYAHYSIRGPSELKQEAELSKSKGLDRDYAYGWSYGRSELLTLFIPNAKGGGTYEALPEGGKLYDFLKEQGMSKSEWKQYRIPAQSIGIPAYWGDMPFTEGPYYVGAVVVFLFVLALIVVHGPVKWALLYATLFSLLLSLGSHSFGLREGLLLLALPVAIWALARAVPKAHPALWGAALTALGLAIANSLDGGAPDYRLTDLFFDYLPYYNKFRAPSSMLVIAAIAMPWLAALGAHTFLTSDRPVQDKVKDLAYATGITAGLAWLLALLPDMFFDFTSSEEVERFAKAEAQQKPLIDVILADRQLLFRNDAFRSLFLVLATAGVLFAAVKGYLKQLTITAALLGALFVVDLISIDTRYLSHKDFVVRKQDFNNVLEAKEADRFIQQDKGYYRVFAYTRNPFNDAFTSYHHRSVGGYNAAKVRRYQQVIERHLGRQTNPPFSQNVLNMLNVKYMLVPQGSVLPGWTPLYNTRDGDRNGQNVTILGNDLSYGPCWITPNVLVVNGPDAALDTIGGLNSRVTAVIESKDKDKLTAFSTDSVDAVQEQVLLVKPDNKRMEYTYKSPKTRFVTFSEVYYNPDWKAYIDGKEAHIFHTNFILRGLIVPAGEHKIEFQLEPAIVQTSSLISYACSVLLLLALGFVVIRAVRTPTPAAPGENTAA